MPQGVRANTMEANGKKIREIEDIKKRNFRP
jgi:hypothetical protein